MTDAEARFHSKFYVLDENGEPKAEPDPKGWGKWFYGMDRHIGKTEIGKVLVSTVFLGIDHGFHPGRPPVLFETMVFGGPLDQEQERYETKAQAEQGHRLWVERVRMEEVRT